MQLKTRAFGVIEIDEEKAVELTEPMPGFSGLRKFAVLDPDPDNPFKWFQSLDDSDVCFLIADPQMFFPDYSIELSSSALPDLDLQNEGEALVAVIINLGGDPSQMTANLRAPLIFNFRRNLCRQVILDDVSYKVRTPLFPNGADAEAGQKGGGA
jgi:flagellar assembly factor FliW